MAVVFLPGVKKPENAWRAARAAKRRNDEQIARRTVYIAKAENGPGPKRAVHFSASHKAAGAGVRRMTDSRCDGTASVGDVLVLERNRISNRLPTWSVLADDTSTQRAELKNARVSQGMTSLVPRLPLGP